jgi:hypothetical protein
MAFRVVFSLLLVVAVAVAYLFSGGGMSTISTPTQPTSDGIKLK